MSTQTMAKRVEVEEPGAVVEVEAPEIKIPVCLEPEAEVTRIIVESGTACIGKRLQFYCSSIERSCRYRFSGLWERKRPPLGQIHGGVMLVYG